MCVSCVSCLYLVPFSLRSNILAYVMIQSDDFCLVFGVYCVFIFGPALYEPLTTTTGHKGCILVKSLNDNRSLVTPNIFGIQSHLDICLKHTS